MTDEEHSRIETSRTRFLTRDELARRWGCSISTLKRMEAEELKPIRLGRRLVRYSLANIEELESQR